MAKRSNPVEIYNRVLRVEAEKGPGHLCDAGCKAAGHRYYHDFKKGSKARIVGEPDGSIRITAGRKNPVEEKAYCEGCGKWKTGSVIRGSDELKPEKGMKPRWRQLCPSCFQKLRR